MPTLRALNQARQKLIGNAIARSFITHHGKPPPRQTRSLGQRGPSVPNVDFSSPLLGGYVLNVTLLMRACGINRHRLNHVDVCHARQPR
jgi:hypothetical protein